MMVKEIRLKFQESVQRTSTTKSFRFTGQERIDFIPGQFLQFIFDEDNKNNRELNKYLSFSSSPTNDYIEVTKRLSASQFSQRLNSLKPNDMVTVKAPMGTCVFDQNDKKIGFVIGGIGITPVISIVEYIIDKEVKTDIVLFYSNKSEEDIAFKKELDTWQSISKNIKLVYTITDCQPKDDKCVFGKITNELIANKEYDMTQRKIFIFGPPKMVNTMKNLCIEIGCKKENLRTESFIGY
ncbi:MAG: FAD-binding oxidoreductase [Candidatus Omnitrophota bacterium]|nr:FAD-binding oxidoreductase [Candidatus Omnitrophota bacterium]